MNPNAAADQTGDGTRVPSSSERPSWSLLGVTTAAFGLLAVTTIQGAIASNRYASALYRENQERELRVFESASLDPATVRRGRDVYLATCTACHGPNGEALPNLGKDLAHSAFVAQQTDKALQTFLLLGRPTWDPANTTKIDMPGKGGNPMLKEADLADTVQFLRFLQALTKQ